MAIQLSCQEIVEHGKALVFYKSDIGGGKKVLVPVESFEKAIRYERVLKQAMNWKRFNFVVERVTESWDKFYYSIRLNGEFLATKSCKDDANELIYSLVKKLNIKKYTIEKGEI